MESRRPIRRPGIASTLGAALVLATCASQAVPATARAAPPTPAPSGGAPGVDRKLLAPTRFAVAGSTATTGEYELAGERPVDLELSASSFRLRLPPDLDAEWLTDERDFGHLSLDEPPPSHLDPLARLVLPLNDLPDGARIEELVCRFLDADPFDDLTATFNLHRRNRLTTAPELLASLTTESSGASQELFSAVASSIGAVVDSRDHHWIEGTFEVGFPTPVLAFYGCTLTYTETRLPLR